MAKKVRNAVSDLSSLELLLTPTKRGQAEPGKQSGSLPEASLKVARTILEIEEFRNGWSDWCQDPDLDIDVFLAEQRIEEDISQPYVVGIYRDRRLDCLLVARISTERMGLSFGGVRMRLPEARMLRIVANGYLGHQNKQNSELLVRALIDALSKGEADVAEITNVLVDSTLYHAATTVPGIVCRDHFPPRVFHRCLCLPGSYEEFVAGLSRNKRHSLKRGAKALLTQFSSEVSIRCLDRDICLEEFINDCEAIAGRAYQRKIGTGFVANSATRERLRIQAGKGYLRGYVLYIAETPMAFIMGTQRGDTFCGKTMAYDSDCRKYSPGSFLLSHCIEELIAKSIAKFDFGPGDHRYKEEFATHEWREATVGIFAPRAKTIALGLLRAALAFVAHSMKVLLANPHRRDTARRIYRSLVLQKRDWFHSMAFLFP